MAAHSLWNGILWLFKLCLKWSNQHFIYFLRLGGWVHLRDSGIFSLWHRGERFQASEKCILLYRHSDQITCFGGEAHMRDCPETETNQENIPVCNLISNQGRDRKNGCRKSQGERALLHLIPGITYKNDHCGLLRVQTSLSVCSVLKSSPHTGLVPLPKTEHLRMQRKHRNTHFIPVVH